MRVLIVDDERLARAELRRLLQAHADVEIIGEAASATEAESQVRRLRPDLLFLDVEMPAHDGFELIERLNPAPRVIFVTAFDEYAVRAFEVSAVDYLLKPVAPERLAAALQRAYANQPMPAGSGSPAPLAPTQRIFVRDGERCWVVRLADVVLLESEGNYTRLCFAGHRPLVLRSLRYLEARLDPDLFFRSSRQQIVNVKAIEEVSPSVEGGLDLRLTGGLGLTMSRRRARDFRERMSL